MPITYKSRRGKTWRLFEGKTKLGKPKFFLSLTAKSASGKPAAVIPEGFEIYEDPDGRVLCRKKLPVLITDDEIALVERELAANSQASCLVERKGVDLIVHEAQGGGGIREFSAQMRIPVGQLADLIKKSQRYQPIFKFELIDEKKRLFEASRWCFRGMDDGWMSLAWAKSLAGLVKKYVKHIGQESYYELF